MAAKSGRGAALLKALEAKKLAEAERERNLGITPEGKVPLGRGALVEQFRRQHGHTSASTLGTPPSSSSGCSTGQPEPVKPSTSSSSYSGSMDERSGSSIHASSELLSAHVSRMNISKPRSTSPTMSLDSGRSSIHKRPDPVVMKGSKGERIDLATNFLRLEVDEGRCVHEYRVTFDPAVDSVRERERLLFQLKDVIGERNQRSYDGHKILYLPRPLPDEETVLTTTFRNTGETITVRLKFIREKSFSDPDCIQFFNILFNKIMKILKFVRMKQSFFDPQMLIKLTQHKLEIWPGYVTSVSEKEGGLMILCDVSHRVLRTDTALDLIHDCRRLHQREHLKTSLQEMIRATLLGQVVLTRYNNATYIIDDIDLDLRPTDVFECRGKQISFIDYYRDQYNIESIEPNQPMLISRPRKRDPNFLDREIILVPQICYMTGLRDDQRQNFKVMKDLADVTSLGPAAREKQIEKFASNIAETPEAREILSVWGVQLAAKPLRLEGRVLEPVKLLFANQRQIEVDSGDFSKSAKDEKPISARPIRQWVIIFDPSSRAAVDIFLNLYKHTAEQSGMSWTAPERVRLKDDRTETYLRAIEQHTTPEVQFNVTVMPSRRDDRYNAVKKLCLLKLNIINQVVLKKTLERRQVNDIVSKIALQINAKMGGELWSLKAVFKNSMIIGIDVWHPKDRGSKSVSVAAIVCSLNQEYSRWYSLPSKQAGNTELIDAIKRNLVQALSEYQRVNHQLPDRIIVFRDGVGDGRLESTQKYEIPQFESAFKTMKEGYGPKLTYVIVSKRVSEKFMHISRQNREMRNNAPVGTVVDHTVTRRDYFDFFLVSQKCNVGTATPTHYLVLHNGADLSPDQVQMLSYRLTHMYYNWAGTVRVPAPCLYADRLASTCGQRLGSEPSLSLADKLYYI